MELAKDIILWESQAFQSNTIQIGTTKPFIPIQKAFIKNFTMKTI
jgi:hypothetical protein